MWTYWLKLRMQGTVSKKNIRLSILKTQKSLSTFPITVTLTFVFIKGILVIPQNENMIQNYANLNIAKQNNLTGLMKK